MTVMHSCNPFNSARLTNTTNKKQGMEEKRLAHANFAAHLFAGVSELNGETDLNLDSPGASQSGDKLRDKDKSIKYVVNGRNMHTDGSLSDTPYTAYWNKYHPKNANGNSLDIYIFFYTVLFYDFVLCFFLALRFGD
jgi:hypothetical protein